MTTRPAIRVIEAVHATQWAMTEAYVQTMLAIAEREHEVTVEALEAYRVKNAADAAGRYGVRNGVGVITARGPFFRYADFFSSISGATTYEGIALDLRRALDDHSVRAILLNIDSPGGEVNGMHELASAVSAANSVKPVVAYVGGSGASAAYLLASSAREIVIAPNAVLGSIGIVATFRDAKGREEKSGIRTIEIVSSQSPRKRPDIDTDEGRAAIQSTVDALGAVFIEHVAANRGLTPDEVISKFGAGGVEVGQRAVAAGMADRIGSFEATLQDLSAGRVTALPAPKPKGTPIMSDKTPEQIAAEQAEALRRATAEATAAAAARFKAIMALDSANGREAQAQTFATDTDLPVEKVDALLKAAPVAAAPAPADPNARRSAEAPGGLVHADPPAPPTPAKGKTETPNYQGIYDKFAGRSDPNSRPSKAA